MNSRMTGRLKTCKGCPQLLHLSSQNESKDARVILPYGHLSRVGGRSLGLGGHTLVRGLPDWLDLESLSAQCSFLVSLLHKSDREYIGQSHSIGALKPVLFDNSIH